MGNQFEAGYKQSITEELLTYQECQWLRFQCSECGADLAAGSRTVHWQIQHGVEMGAGGGHQWENPPNQKDIHRRIVCSS